VYSGQRRFAVGQKNKTGGSSYEKATGSGRVELFQLKQQGKVMGEGSNGKGRPEEVQGYGDP